MSDWSDFGIIDEDLNGKVDTIDYILTDDENDEATYKKIKLKKNNNMDEFEKCSIPIKIIITCLSYLVMLFLVGFIPAIVLVVAISENYQGLAFIVSLVLIAIIIVIIYAFIKQIRSILKKNQSKIEKTTKDDKEI